MGGYIGLADNSIQSNPIQSNPIQSNPIQSNPIQSNPIRSKPNLKKQPYKFTISDGYTLVKITHTRERERERERERKGGGWRKGRKEGERKDIKVAEGDIQCWLTLTSSGMCTHVHTYSPLHIHTFTHILTYTTHTHTHCKCSSPTQNWTWNLARLPKHSIMHTKTWDPDFSSESQTPSYTWLSPVAQGRSYGLAMSQTSFYFTFITLQQSKKRSHLSYPFRGHWGVNRNTQVSMCYVLRVSPCCPVLCIGIFTD